jgi:hypothetical protein
VVEVKDFVLPEPEEITVAGPDAFDHLFEWKAAFDRRTADIRDNLVTYHGKRWFVTGYNFMHSQWQSIPVTVEFTLVEDMTPIFQIRYVPNLEAMAKAICSAWPKVPDGCAAICMQRLGDIPPEGCRYAVEVHGERARKVLYDSQGT